MDKYLLHARSGVDEVTYPFPNFNGCTIEVGEWVNYFIPHITEM